VLLTNINGPAFTLEGGTAKVDFTGKITQDANDEAAVAIGGGHKEGTESGQNTGVVTFNERALGEGIVSATVGTGLQLPTPMGHTTSTISWPSSATMLLTAQPRESTSPRTPARVPMGTSRSAT